MILRIAIGIVVTILLLVIAVFAGLQIQPAPLSPLHKTTGQVTTVPLPAGLPAPVERFYHKLYGENIPVIQSAVITGRATVRPPGMPTFPARFRFTHDADKGYRHYIEATVFGLPLLTVSSRIPPAPQFGWTMANRGRYSTLKISYSMWMFNNIFASPDRDAPGIHAHAQAMLDPHSALARNSGR